jgi:hypothetical protein
MSFSHFFNELEKWFFKNIDLNTITTNIINYKRGNSISFGDSFIIFKASHTGSDTILNRIKDLNSIIAINLDNIKIYNEEDKKLYLSILLFGLFHVIKITKSNQSKEYFNIINIIKVLKNRKFIQKYKDAQVNTENPKTQNPKQNEPNHPKILVNTFTQSETQFERKGKGNCSYEKVPIINSESNSLFLNNSKSGSSSNKTQSQIQSQDKQNPFFFNNIGNEFGLIKKGYNLFPSSEESDQQLHTQNMFLRKREMSFDQEKKTQPLFNKVYKFNFPFCETVKNMFLKEGDFSVFNKISYYKPEYINSLVNAKHSKTEINGFIDVYYDMEKKKYYYFKKTNVITRNRYSNTDVKSLLVSIPRYDNNKEIVFEDNQYNPYPIKFKGVLIEKCNNDFMDSFSFISLDYKDLFNKIRKLDELEQKKYTVFIKENIDVLFVPEIANIVWNVYSKTIEYRKNHNYIYILKELINFYKRNINNTSKWFANESEKKVQNFLNYHTNPQNQPIPIDSIQKNTSNSTSNITSTITNAKVDSKFKKVPTARVPFFTTFYGRYAYNKLNRMKK